MKSMIVLALSSTLLFTACNSNPTQNQQNTQVDTMPPVTNTNLLQQQIDSIIKDKKATVGVYIAPVDNFEDAIKVNADASFPSMSTMKFPLAIAVLQSVQAGKLSMDEPLNITKNMLRPNTHSPFRDKYPNGKSDLLLKDALKYIVAESDNILTDIVMEKIGGPAAVEQVISDKDMQIKIFKKEINNWEDQYKNNSTPSAYSKVLHQFAEGYLLNDTLTQWLMQTMTQTTTGKNRLKGKLPNVPIAHKTGTSNTNEQGLTAAINDAGIITLENGKQYIIVVFVKDCSESFEAGEAIIADIALAAYNFYNK